MSQHHTTASGSIDILNAILDYANFSIIITDPAGVIKAFNRAAENMLGYSAEEVIDKQTPAILHKVEEVVSRAQVISQKLGYAVEPGFGVFIEISKSTGAADENEWTYIRKNGTEFPIYLSVTAIFDSNKNITGYMGIAVDISKQKNSERDLQKERDKAMESAKLASLGEMAGGISHEINNPIAVVIGKAHQILFDLEKDPVDAMSIRRHAEKIEQTCLRVTKIVKGLRSFARDAQGDPMEPTSVKTIVEDTLAFCHARFRSHGVHLDLDLSKDVKILCRPTQISQVLLNLLNNAFDAVCNGSEKWVRIEVQESGDQVHISVIDSGHGIPDDLKIKIMQPFFTTKEVGKGTGLGLSISKGILDSHHGVLELNDKHVNTCFVMKLKKAD